MEVVKLFHHNFLQKVQITNQYSRCLTKVEPVGQKYLYTNFKLIDTHTFMMIIIVKC